VHGSKADAGPKSVSQLFAALDVLLLVLELSLAVGRAGNVVLGSSLGLQLVRGEAVARVDDGHGTVVHLEGTFSGPAGQGGDAVLVGRNETVAAFAEVDQHVAAFLVANDARVDCRPADAGLEGLDAGRLVVFVFCAAEHHDFAVGQFQTLSWTLDFLGSHAEVSRLGKNESFSLLAVELARQHHAGGFV